MGACICGRKLTGALAPLRNVQFFEQVFIDFGAVAWPGEIDLAPDDRIAAKRRRPAHIAFTLFIAICAGWLAAVTTSKFLQRLPPEISQTEFLSEVDERHVDKVVIRDRVLINGTSSTRGAFRVRMPVDDGMVNDLRSRGVVVEFETSSDLIP